MNALTLHQPWASLIALGVKTIETRDWPTKYRGPLAIHAGKRWPDIGFVGDYCVVSHPLRMTTVAGPDDWPVPLGAIVATCELVDVVPTVGSGHGIQTWSDGRLMWIRGGDQVDKDITDQRPYGDFTPGRFAWLLDDIKPVDSPVPYRGRQGLWEWKA